jgi:hypothetical protein
MAACQPFDCREVEDTSGVWSQNLKASEVSAISRDIDGIIRERSVRIILKSQWIVKANKITRIIPIPVD